MQTQKQRRCPLLTLVSSDPWADFGGTECVRWRSGGGAFSCLSEIGTFSLTRYKTWRTYTKNIAAIGDIHMDKKNDK